MKISAPYGSFHDREARCEPHQDGKEWYMSGVLPLRVQAPWAYLRLDLPSDVSKRPVLTRGYCPILPMSRRHWSVPGFFYSLHSLFLECKKFFGLRRSSICPRQAGPPGSWNSSWRPRGLNFTNRVTFSVFTMRTGYPHARQTSVRYRRVRPVSRSPDAEPRESVEVFWRNLPWQHGVTENKRVHCDLKAIGYWIP